MNIKFRKLNDCDADFQLLYKWCKQPFVYEWFEQRELSIEEIIFKYQAKLSNKKQNLYIVIYDNKEIGFAQIYRFENDIKVSNSNRIIYEFDLFIGEEGYLSKGIGTVMVNRLSDLIFSEYKADAIILRPFKRNVRAIKCYEKCGYQVIDEYDGTDTLNNPEVIEVLIRERK